ncbi:MAG: hypothetical protein H6807_00410 [Planctomycetes bacterium]|nr:hypothetical protein [Planctomycetota bacterium]
MTRSFTSIVTVALVALCLAASASAQIVLYSEDFATASGTTPPSGWTTDATGSNPALWRFDNAGGRSFDAPFAAPFAVCDADDNGSGTAGISSLTSAPFDTSFAIGANLIFDQQFRDLTSGWTIEVFDGTVWNVVDSKPNDSGPSINIGYGGTPNVVTTTYNIAAFTGGATNCQVRFSYEYGWDWWWGIDNLVIEEPPAFDLTMDSIDAPSFGGELCFLPAAPSTVTCTMTNNGGVAMPAGFMVNMQLTVDATIVATEAYALPAAVASGASFQYTFTATANLTTAGMHDVDCEVLLVGDSNPADNALTRSYDLNVTHTAKTVGWSEDFESHATVTGSTVVPAGWSNDPNDSTGTFPDWRNEQGTTPSGVGPTVDHTTGTATGWYMMIEDSSGTDSNPINLITPCLDLSGTVNPHLFFWQFSDEIPGGPLDNVLEIDVIDLSNGGVVTMSAATILGNGAGSGWTQQIVDLSAFAGNIVKCVFRGRNDNGDFYDDEAIDDVSLVDLVYDVGQAPRAGLAVFRIDNPVNNVGFGVDSGQPGPYFTTINQGDFFDIVFEGEANQPVTSFFAPLNRGAATFGLIGQMDCGVAALNPMTGFPSDLTAFGDGILFHTTPGLPFGFDALWITDGTGTGSMTLRMPTFGLPSGTVLTTFQFGILSSSAPFSYLANAIEVTLN